MRYQVPQFINVESKIFGPFTLKQFIYLFGGGGILFLFYVLFPLWLAFLLGLPVGFLAAAFAFYPINNRPFIFMVENALKYFASPRLFLWRKAPPKKVTPKDVNKKMEAQSEIYIPKFTKSKLRDLAWSLDIKSKSK